MIITAKNIKRIIVGNAKKEDKRYVKRIIKKIKDELKCMDNEDAYFEYSDIYELSSVKEVEKYFKKRGFKTSFRDKGFDSYTLRLSWND